MVAGKKLDILYLNIRSIKKHLNDLNDFLVINNLSPTIISLTETWLSNDSYYNPTLNGYTFISGDLNKKVGGVAFFIKDFIHFNTLRDFHLDVNNCEDLWIEVHESNIKSIVGIIYRHPERTDIPNFQKKFTETVFKLNKTKKKYFILGDFNYCLKNDSHIDYTNTLLNLGCTQIVEQPTHPNPVNDSLIDHIYSNCCDKEIKLHHIKADITDHHILHLVIKDLPVTSNKVSKMIMKRSMKNFSEENYCNDLAVKLDTIKYEINNGNADINNLFQQFIDIINEVIDTHCPRVKLSKKSRKLTLKPWITKEILKSYRIEKKLYLKK